MITNVLVVLSGGMDSTTLLYWLLARPEYYGVKYCVNFFYGSKHNEKEREMARLTCKNLKLELIEIDMDFIGKYFKSDLLKSGGEVPEGHYADENMKKTVVPFRNGIMLSIAAGLAESFDLNAVALGNHYGDHAIYPDCRVDFIEPMALAIKKGTWKNVKLLSPFATVTKTDIAKIGGDLKVPFQNTYTCYKGGDKHCGKCGSCVERLSSFKEAGVVDPTEYEDVEFFNSCIE
jgi:7-cyano-7-deazaguanine synthase